MDEFLRNLIALSLGGGGAVLLLLLAARLGQFRYAARWRCLGWLLLCLRLAIPVPLLPDAPAVPAPPIQVEVPADRVLYRTTPPEELPAVPAEDGMIPEGPDTSEVQTALSLSQLLFGIWLAGAAAVLGSSLIRHGRFVQYLCRWSQPVTEGETLHCFNQLGDQLNLDRRPDLLLCEGIRVPMLAGIFHPVLLLPAGGLSGQDLRYSILHELTHYRRRDILRKTLALWVCALHWFNPCVWLMARAVERDTELACDEGALAQLPEQEHGAYGHTILDAVDRMKGAAL